jgi:hypothetical protein
LIFSFSLSPQTERNNKKEFDVKNNKMVFLETDRQTIKKQKKKKKKKKMKLDCHLFYINYYTIIPSDTGFRI